MKVTKVTPEAGRAPPRPSGTVRRRVGPLDMTRSFLPEALAALAPLDGLDVRDRLVLNQVRAGSYLHLFDLLETSLGAAAREREHADIDVRAVVAPLLCLDCFDHHDLFSAFLTELSAALPAAPRLIEVPGELTATLAFASPLSLLVLALHLKLITQQHYLACVRGDESLEPHFVRLLKDHWGLECGAAQTSSSVLAIQQRLAQAPAGRVPSALRDYRLLVFACDDVLRAQAELDVVTLEAARGEPLRAARAAIVDAQIAAHRKAFLTMGIVNAAFVYAMRSLGPTAPSALAGIVSALSPR